MTALHVVCRSGARHEDVKIMVDLYPDLINSQTPRGGDTPLHFAVAANDLQTIQILLDAQPSAALIQSTRNGYFGDKATPLHVALCHQARPEIIEAVVLASRRSLKIRDGNGQLPHQLARMYYEGNELEQVLECLSRRP